MKNKRQSGGQPGNNNAFKHGFYSEKLKKKARLQFDLASGVHGVDEEITLLRVQLKEAMDGGDTRNLVPLVKTALALEKLLRTRQKYFTVKDPSKDGFKNVLRDILVPAGGIKAVLELAHCRYPDEFPADMPLDEAASLNNLQNRDEAP
jgi:hypothetical protein